MAFIHNLHLAHAQFYGFELRIFKFWGGTLTLEYRLSGVAWMIYLGTLMFVNESKKIIING